MRVMAYGGGPYGGAAYGGTFHWDLSPSNAPGTPPVLWSRLVRCKWGRADAETRSRVMWLMTCGTFGSLFGEMTYGTTGEWIGLVVGIAWADWWSRDGF